MIFPTSLIKTDPMSIIQFTIGLRVGGGHIRAIITYTCERCGLFHNGELLAIHPEICKLSVYNLCGGEDKN